MRQGGKEADRGYVINSDPLGQLELSPAGDLWESLEHELPVSLPLWTRKLGVYTPFPSALVGGCFPWHFWHSGSRTRDSSQERDTGLAGKVRRVRTKGVKARGYSRTQMSVCCCVWEPRWLDFLHYDVTHLLKFTCLSSSLLHTY